MRMKLGMGVIRFIFDAGLITTGASALRRTAGISIKDILLAKIQNPYASKAITVYFDAGEKLCQKCISAYNSVTGPVTGSANTNSNNTTSTSKKD